MDLTIPHTFLPLAFFELGRTVISTYTAGIVLLVIGLLAAKSDVAKARGLDKVVAYGNLFFALPLAVFSAEHFSAAKGISQIVPKFMPWPLFWTYLVGVALLAASLSIATKILVQWSGLLWGIMMFLFVAMMDIPGTLAQPHNRFNWILTLRELSFGAGGWALAGGALKREGLGGSWLISVGRIIIGGAAVVYGVQHFFHPFKGAGCSSGDGDARLDSGQDDHWLRYGHDFGGWRIVYRTRAEDADGGHLSWHMDCASGLHRLFGDPYCIISSSEH
jgi:uncharacterized membrane protein